MSARAWHRRRAKAWRRAVLAPRCMACGATRCRGLRGGIGTCPRWQEAEARNARGEYLPTYPVLYGDLKAAR